MNKNEFVSLVADHHEWSKADAAKVVDAVLSSITEVLKNGDDVRIPGFGVFSVSSRAACKGRNPSTGEEITIPARKVPRFSAGKTLKDAVQ